MRIRPDGAGLLEAARGVIDAAIVPNLSDDRRTVVRAIGDALALAEDRLARDGEASSSEVAALDRARAAMRGEVYEALPEERRYDARLVAKAIAVATRQLEKGPVPEAREYERLVTLLGGPAVPPANPHEIRCTLVTLNGRLGAAIRAGEADADEAVHAATLAHLEATVHEALSESNPAYLRRGPSSVPPGSRAAESPAAAVRPVAAAMAAWGEVPSAFLLLFPFAVPPDPLAQRIEAWFHLPGIVGGAMCASGNAALAKQADVFGWFAERLAANARVPMAFVEGAHQAHDLAVTVAEANAALCSIALAPFRQAGAQPAHAARLP